MKIRRRWLLAAAAVAVALVAAVANYLRKPAEPSYGGKPLSHWVMLVAQAPYPARNDQADEAIAHIGPPALPYLLGWIPYAPSAAKQREMALIDVLRSKSSPGSAPPVYTDDQETLANGAALSLHLIAPQTTNALAELAHLAATLPVTNDQTQPDRPAFRICLALQQFGPEGLPHLLNRLTKYKDYHAARTLGRMGTNAYPAIPALVQSLRNTNRELSRSVVSALGTLKHEPVLVIPALTSCLTNSDPTLRYRALKALAEFDAQARPALPAVRPLLADQDYTVREHATNFLNKVAPEALTNAPAH